MKILMRLLFYMNIYAKSNQTGTYPWLRNRNLNVGNQLGMREPHKKQSGNPDFATYAMMFLRV